MKQTYVVALVLLGFVTGLGLANINDAPRQGGDITVDPIIYDKCQEGEVLAPTAYAYSQYVKLEDGTVRGVGERFEHYVCVALDDFADPESVARLDAIVAERQRGN